MALEVNGDSVTGSAPSTSNYSWVTSQMERAREPFSTRGICKPPHILPPLEASLHSPFHVTIPGDWVKEGVGDERGQKSLQ